MKSKYTKMQSNGNDFLITEDIKLVSKTKELSDRIKNIGFDQLLFLPQVAGKKSTWKIVEKQFIQV